MSILWNNLLWHDFRGAWRGLYRGGLVTILAGLSLALTIAGNTAIFGVISGLLFRPLPFFESDRLVLIDEREAERATVETLRASLPNYLDWSERGRAFADFAGLRPARFSLGHGEAPEPVSGALVTPEFFRVLGVEPLLGRSMTEAETRPGVPRVVVLSHAWWERRFAADPAVVGRELILDEESCTVIGVMPPEFEFLYAGIELWTPMRIDPALAGTLELPRDRRDMTVVARLAPGAGMEEARADMAALAARLADEHPKANQGFVVGLLNLRHEYPDPRTRRLFAIFQGTIFFVLLIACANIANLLLARSEERRRELALRAVLGASRLSILRQLLAESLLLAGLGGGAGILLGALAIRQAAVAMAHLLPRYWTPEVDLRVLAFSLGLTGLAGLACGLAPALQSFRPRLAEVIREDARGAAGSSKRRLARGLVVAEIALSLILLSGAGALIRTFLSFQNLEPGYAAAPERLLNVELAVPASADDAEVHRRLEAVVDRLGALPGVSHAVLTSSAPQNPFIATQGLVIDSRPTASDEKLPQVLWLTAAPGFPEMLETPVVQGRFFDAGDRVGAPLVAVINQALADSQWPGASPLGERVTLLGQSREIVGVIGNVRQSLIDTVSITPAVYLPPAQKALHDVTVMLRGEIAPHLLMETVRSEIVAVDPRLTLAALRTQHEFVDQWFTGVHVFNGLLGGFGALALLLAAIGTYGVLAYAVTRRTREIGVRMALGARPQEMTRMVARQGLKLGLVGLLFGLPGAWAVVRTIEGLLEGQAGVDPMTVAVVAGGLLVVTLIAGQVPAQRAAAVDPIEALRYE